MSNETEQVIEDTAESAFPATNEYTSSRGITAIFKPLPPLMREMIGDQMEKDGFDRGSPPTYEVETFGGDFETYVHDLESIKGDALAEAAWLEYQETQKAWEIEYNQRLFKLCIIKCMDVKGVEEPEWIEEQEALGFDIPENRVERKVHYVRTEWIGNNEDYLTIITKPFELSISQSEIQAAAERMFRKLRMAEEDSAEGPGAESGEEELDMAEGSSGRSSDVPEAGDSS